MECAYANGRSAEVLTNNIHGNIRSGRVKVTAGLRIMKLDSAGHGGGGGAGTRGGAGWQVRHYSGNGPNNIPDLRQRIEIECHSIQTNRYSPRRVRLKQSSVSHEPISAYLLMRGCQ